MDRRVRLSLVLIAVAAVAGIVIAAGTGPDPRRVQAGPAELPTLADIASPEETKLWNSRGCVTCHGADAHGSQLGPDLAPVIPLYLAKFGGAEGAKAALAAYLVDPQGSPKLRTDGTTYQNPMPSLLKLFGGTKDDAPVLAGLLLRLAR